MQMPCAAFGFSQRQQPARSIPIRGAISFSLFVSYELLSVAETNLEILEIQSV